jgi:multidrug resistance efflux pump
LNQSLAQTTPATDAGRARIADLRRQRATAVIDVAQLQDAVTNIPPAKSIDLPVKAGVHGVIRSLEARAGTMTAAGVPLVRMLDCDHAFLTVGPESKLRAGQAVQVRLPNLPPVPATVRQSAGIAEPPDSLVIATAPGAFVGQLSGSCPIGATASVMPSMTGS